MNDYMNDRKNFPIGSISGGDVVEFARKRWIAEVSSRPLDNKHRRVLDDTWRQVIREFGGNPDILLGEDHDALLMKGKK